MTEPRKEWYVRPGHDGELFGPVNFQVALRHARYISQLENGPGIAEVVTLVSSTLRAEDPIHIAPNPREFVIYTFIKGRRTFGGRVAQFHSDRGLLTEE